MWTLYLLLGLLVVVVLLVGRVLVRALWQAGPAGRVTLAVGLAVCGWALYRMAVPAPSAYLDEFAKLTGVALPESAKVVERDAAFPDRRGQYRACFVAHLPAAELALVSAKLGSPQPAAGLASCRRHGEGAAGGALVRDDLDTSSAAEAARVRVAVDPSQGRLRAEWWVRRALVEP